MMEAARTSETSVDNHFTRQYNPEDSCEHHTRRRENLKSHIMVSLFVIRLEVCELESGRGDGFLRVIKMHSMPYFGRKNSCRPHVRFDGM
jgi:hypothetical protein